MTHIHLQTDTMASQLPWAITVGHWVTEERWLSLFLSPIIYTIWLTSQRQTGQHANLTHNMFSDTLYLAQMYEQAHQLSIQIPIPKKGLNCTPPNQSVWLVCLLLLFKKLVPRMKDTLCHFPTTIRLHHAILGWLVKEAWQWTAYDKTLTPPPSYILFPCILGPHFSLILKIHVWKMVSD